MKKTTIFIAALLLFSATALSQDLPRIAVYVTGAKEQGTNKALSTRMLSALVNSGRYRAVERSDEFLNKLATEHTKQRSGAINDDQIKKLGKQFGVDFVCITDITTALGSNLVSARIVDVESAEVIAMGDTNSPLQSLDDLTNASIQIVAMMFGMNVGTRQPVQGKPVQSVHVAGNTGVRIDKDGIEMVFVQGGVFKMGCTAEQGNDCLANERPVRNVTLNDFYIQKCEVTQKQWVWVMGSNPSRFKGDNLPVENVSWKDAQEFISKLNSMTGKRYRLPTEAEWEYAARGGAKSRGYVYAGGNNIKDVAWYVNNSGVGETQPAGTKAPNELGLHDMTGNVLEWVNDWYEIYISASETNPTGPPSGKHRVNRGGSWYSNEVKCRISMRYSNPPDNRRHDLGFRLALDP
jgi:formylglycine-generating enzyme required for sulfatase activity